MHSFRLLILSLFCSFLIVFGIDQYSKSILSVNSYKAKYYNSISSRNTSDYAMEQVIDDNSIVVLGSSELSASDNLAFPPSLFNDGNSNYNMILMGAGHLQSLAQAINVGALQNNIKNNKIVLIVSPQWFTGGGVSSDAFSSRFEEMNFVEFIKNKNVSKNTRINVTNRVKELLSADINTLKRVEEYEKTYLYYDSNPMLYIKNALYEKFRNFKTRYELVEKYKALSDVSNYDFVEVEKIDFLSLIPKAYDLGKESCTNNKFGVYDSYYDTYIRDQIKSKKDSDVGASYVTSPEYNDLRLFLDVCKQTNIEPLIISVPVNGRWYDYTGFSKSDRNTYYQKIRNICNEYDAQLVDFSEKEYEIYFLKDIMHMGWKGWVYLDKSVYDFYCDKTITDNTQHIGLTYSDMILSSGASALDNNKYKFITNVVDNNFNSLVVTLENNNFVIDGTSIVERRSGTYLHTSETGYYNIKFIANSNLQDEFLKIKLFLEKDKVYKIEYNVDYLNNKEVDISNVNISEIIY